LQSAKDLIDYFYESIVEARDTFEVRSLLMDQILKALRDRGNTFKGVLYPTFFKTSEGLKIVEINARGGDPELINIVDLMEDDVDLAEVYRLIAVGELEKDSIRYKKLASTMAYLVSPEYGYDKDSCYDFTMRQDVIKALGCNIRFAASIQRGENQYRTAKPSRVVGLSALGEYPWDARALVMRQSVKVLTTLYNLY
jgi:phosphoribosylamine--glycine ligase